MISIVTQGEQETIGNPAVSFLKVSQNRMHFAPHRLKTAIPVPTKYGRLAALQFCVETDANEEDFKGTKK
jgi:hypothetical protein